MQAIEFQTTIKKLISVVPQGIRSELSTHTEDETVRVIVLTSSYPKLQKQKNLLQDAKTKGYDDSFEYLMDHPFDVPNPVCYTREELHER